MILDNIDKVKSLLEFREGIFYYVQVIQRKKENPELSKSDIKRYQTFITSLEDLNVHLPRIKIVCELYNARAYISLIPRSLEKLAKQCALEYVKRISLGEYKRVWDIPNRLALSDEVRAKIPGKKPMWVFDVDEPENTDKIVEIVNKAGISLVDILQTPNGSHILVEAFNPKKLESYRKGEDYEFPSGEKFTFRPDCNTIIYARTP
jgi:hypothetical protein